MWCVMIVILFFRMSGDIWLLVEHTLQRSCLTLPLDGSPIDPGLTFSPYQHSPTLQPLLKNLANCRTDSKECLTAHSLTSKHVHATCRLAKKDGGVRGRRREERGVEKWWRNETKRKKGFRSIVYLERERERERERGVGTKVCWNFMITFIFIIMHDWFSSGLRLIHVFINCFLQGTSSWSLGHRSRWFPEAASTSLHQSGQSYRCHAGLCCS